MCWIFSFSFQVFIGVVDNDHFFTIIVHVKDREIYVLDSLDGISPDIHAAHVAVLVLVHVHFYFELFIFTSF